MCKRRLCEVQCLLLEEVLVLAHEEGGLVRDDLSVHDGAKGCLEGGHVHADGGELVEPLPAQTVRHALLRVRAVESLGHLDGDLSTQQEVRPTVRLNQSYFKV